MTFPTENQFSSNDAIYQGIAGELVAGIPEDRGWNSALLEIDFTSGNVEMTSRYWPADASQEEDLDFDIAAVAQLWLQLVKRFENRESPVLARFQIDADGAFRCDFSYDA